MLTIHDENCGNHVPPEVRKDVCRPIHLSKLPENVPTTPLPPFLQASSRSSAPSAWEELTRLAQRTPLPEPQLQPGSKGQMLPPSHASTQLCEQCPAMQEQYRYKIFKYSDILVLTDPYVALYSAILCHRENLGCSPAHIIVPRRAYDLIVTRHQRLTGSDLQNSRYPFFNGDGLDYMTLHPCEIDLPGRPSSLPRWLQPAASSLGIRLQPDMLLTISPATAVVSVIPSALTSESWIRGHS